MIGPTLTTRTATGYTISDYREIDRRDYWGEIVVELMVDGVGWCFYSWKLSAVWIKDGYHTIH